MLRTIAGHMKSLLDRLATDWQAACMSQPCRSQTRHSAPLAAAGCSGWSVETGEAARSVFGAEAFMVTKLSSELCCGQIRCPFASDRLPAAGARPMFE